MRRGSAGPRTHHVALPIDVLDTEGWVDGGLVGVGGWAGEVVEGEAGQELIFGRELVVEADGELVRIGGHLGSRRIGARAVRAGNIVGAGVACKDSGDRGVDGNGEGVGAAVGVSDGVDAGALCGGGHGHHLGGAEHLAEALVLREVEGALAAVEDVREIDRAAVGEAELVAAEGRNAAGIGGRGVVKVVARVEGGVAHELEEGAVETAGAGAGDGCW